MKDSKHKYDYGRCHVCGERMDERQIKQDFWIRGKLIIIEGVPSGVCPQCGKKVVRADVGRQIATLIENSNRLPKVRIVLVPVIQFADVA